MSFLRVQVVGLSFGLVLLCGCGAGTSVKAVEPSGGSAVQGRVIGGQNPVNDALVTVWPAGETGYGSAAMALATTHTKSDGTFSFPANSYTCTDPNEPLYITASGGDPGTGVNNPDIMLATGLGACSGAPSELVEINEVTTAATAYALAQFFTTTLGAASADSFGSPLGDLPALQLSNASTIPTLVSVANGTVQPNTAEITIEAAKIYSIANTLAACVNSDPGSSTSCSQLFGDTKPPVTGSIEPTDTLQAAVQMALYPYQNVSDLFKLGSKDAPFSGLNGAPHDWTLGVSYSTTTLALGITGTATSRTSTNIDIDASGRVWVPTNLYGSAGVGYFDPATATFNGPYANGTLKSTSLTSSQLIQPQYVGIDQSGTLWVTDESSSTVGLVDTSSPSTASGGSLGTAGGLGPVAIDGFGNALIAYANGSAYGFLSMQSTGSHTLVAPFAQPATGIIALSSAADTQAFGALSGNQSDCYGEEGSNTGAGAVTTVYVQTGGNCVSGLAAAGTAGFDSVFTGTSLNEVCSALAGKCVPIGAPLSGPEGIATDGRGQFWVANSANDSVTTFGVVADAYAAPSSLAYVHDSANGNTMTAPYGLAIDGSGNVWVSNPSCVTTTSLECLPTSLTLSELIGAAAPTITPLSSQMDGTLTGTLPGVSAPVTDARGAAKVAGPK